LIQYCRFGDNRNLMLEIALHELDASTAFKRDCDYPEFPGNMIDDVFTMIDDRPVRTLPKRMVFEPFDRKRRRYRRRRRSHVVPCATATRRRLAFAA